MVWRERVWEANIGRAVEYGWEGGGRHLHTGRMRHERDTCAWEGYMCRNTRIFEDAEEDKNAAD
jgi:hypothetical protein